VDTLALVSGELFKVGVGGGEMSKPKPEWIGTKEQWYTAGLADGEKRLAMALRKLLAEHEFNGNFIVSTWLTARLKRRKG
jgi:hypothetical protein